MKTLEANILKGVSIGNFLILKSADKNIVGGFVKGISPKRVKLSHKGKF